jgi:glycosyltransferase involved in cell wall biosynthesis
MSEALRISVIIPAYNAADTIGRCLEALGAQTHPPDEIIVVDDGSTDDTARVAGAFDVHVITQPNQGPGAARNRGVAAAQGDLILFTDADCAPTPEWVEHMVVAFENPEVIGAKGIYGSHQQELVARFVQLEYENKYDRMCGTETIDFVDTYSAGYRKNDFLAFGGFDTTFPTASVEDQEFSFRLAEAGHRLVFVPEACVFHIHDQTLREYVRRKFWIGYWKARVVRAHPSKLVRDSHTPQVLKLQMGLAGLGGLLLIGGLLDGRLALGGLMAWGLLMLSAIPFLIKVWRRDRPVLLIAPLMLFLRAWALGLGFLLGNLRWLLPR